MASLGEPPAATPAGLAWHGIQTAAAQIGAKTSLLEPVSNADIPGDLDLAARAADSVVVTVGPAAYSDVLVAAKAHPKTQFLELDVYLPEGTRANVHGLVFDEAQAGYIGGYVAASLATSGKIGMVEDAATDPSSINYAAGFKSGASQANANATVTIGYATTATAPDQGRTAATTLIDGGAKVIMAMPSLSGIGAMRESCAEKAQVIALGTDAWLTVPDIQSCLIVSVVKRYDVAVGSAVVAIASGKKLNRSTLSNVANGGIALSDFHATLPDSFHSSLDALLAKLKTQ